MGATHERTSVFRRHARRGRGPVPRLAAAAVTAAVLALPAAAARTPPDDPLVPRVIVGSFRVQVRAGSVVELLAFRLPDSWAQRRVRGAAFVGDVVEHRGTRTFGRAGQSPGVVERRTFPARPDGFSFSEQLAFPLEYVLAQARGGKLGLAETTVGRRSLRAKVRLHANDCAGLRAGSAELWLDPQRLLPLQMIEHRGRQTFTRSYAYTARGSTGRERFVAPPVGRRPLRGDHRFRRTSPAAAAQALSYTPQLPTALPTGFALAVAGWAPRSGRTGPEASNPPYAELFAAVYRRGFERIDVTQRRSGRGWLADPFGAECAFVRSERATVAGVHATYGIGETIVSHLYWRAGDLLHTVSGPFPKAELVRIAESLAPVTR